MSSPEQPKYPDGAPYSDGNYTPGEPVIPAEPVYEPPRQRVRQRSQLPGLLILLAVLAALLFLPRFAENLQYSITRGRQRAAAEIAKEQLAELPEAVNRYVLAARAVEPSVVGVRMTKVVGRQAGDEWAMFGQQPNAMEGQGSGVIVDTEGYILTNFHVVNGASEVIVTLASGQKVDAKIVGADPGSDVAVLKVNASNLVAAPLGDSRELEVGDQVLAVGSPYGLAQTVTAGIVSAKERRGLPVPNIFYQDFLQTDAAVNPGNSGGPLVNLKGEVVGINTAIFGERYQGISFAIPSRIAKEVYDRLRKGEKIARGWLGVRMQPLTERLAQRLGLEDARGALVTDVIEGAPAARAGVNAGDVIVEWDGKAINDENDLRFRVAGTPVGSSVAIVVIRDGERVPLSVTVAERPSILGQ